MTFSTVNRSRSSEWRKGVALLLCAMGLCAMGLAGPVLAQYPAGTSLMVQIRPEARLSQPSVSVTLVVDASGAISEQRADLRAWIRTLPGQMVQFVAQSGPVKGPGGTAPAGLLRWRGAVAGATGGGRSARCTSGAFTGGVDLLSTGWPGSGTLDCQVAFTLDAAQDPAPGVYTAEIVLSLYAE